MKVLWLTQLPYTQLPNTKNPKGHPVPWITSLAKELSKKVDLTIISNNSKLEKDEEVYIDGVRYLFIKLHRASINLLTANRLNSSIVRKHLEREILEHDIMHIHGSEGMYQQACWDLAIPTVLSVQGIIDQYYPHLQEHLSNRRILWKIIQNTEQRYLSKMNNFMCRTDWDKGWVRKISPESKIHHCWESLREEFFNYDINPVNNNSVIYIGGCDYIKGYREALKSFNTALESAPDMNMIFITSGGLKDRKTILKFIKNQTLDNLNEHNLIFINRLSPIELIEQYKNCFCLLHPSYIDNSPNTICEAQALGLPVIASNVGGVSSLIKHQETGILSSLKTEELARSIATLYFDKNKQEYLSTRAKLESRSRHNIFSVVNKTLNIYENIINTQSKLAPVYSH
ncbi:glycosyltransferase family 4 protein [Spirosoma utsteinense]|uniref:Glycosyltransferase involved in cell wall biosynthesis n=1 Tax=Spirosoma utsteinense TaxID=2585773 RepID=A0ABR6W951_9BACT|nr:glycosyltransferase [Spirosoma utsteinense]MBC3787408.1 glycosyltransferase involved in cell wall biosynthesis [Spirosoma utsteinense]MBC3793037.1 glycosyltransferase involved in cell wall biosynthesis [Spirosoma utsteinense]